MYDVYTMLLLYLLMHQPISEKTRDRKVHYKKKVASFFTRKVNESNAANASAKSSGCDIYFLPIKDKETLGLSKQLFGKSRYLSFR